MKYSNGLLHELLRLESPVITNNPDAKTKYAPITIKNARHWALKSLFRTEHSPTRASTNPITKVTYNTHSGAFPYPMLIAPDPCLWIQDSAPAKRKIPVVRQPSIFIPDLTGEHVQVINIAGLLHDIPERIPDPFCYDFTLFLRHRQRRSQMVIMVPANYGSQGYLRSRC